jgi:16S rRNA (guanine527-N7)-methyltransferase
VLLQANATRNLTRLTEPDRLVIGMFVDSLLFLRPLAGLPHGTILDVGTGAGFPAVPLALALPGSSIVAIDSRLMKIEFLQEAAGKLGLSNLTARHVRAEDYAAEFGAARMDVVVARALAHPAEALTLTLPLVRPKGAVVLAVGTRGLAEELAAGAACLKRFHSSAAAPSPYRLPGYDNDFAHVVVTRAQ